MRILPIMVRPLVAAACGVMLTLGYAPANRGWVVWLWMLPLIALLWTVEGKRARWKGFGLGWICGVVFFLNNLSWMNTVSVLATVALSCYCALFFGMWGAFMAGTANPWKGDHAKSCHPLCVIAVSAACAGMWCGLEWLRGWFLTGFGWNGIAVTFHDNRLISQCADITGISGLAFLPVFVQCAAVQIAKRAWTRSAREFWRIDAAAAVLLVACACGYGALRIRQMASVETCRVKALLIQLNIPQDAAHVMVPSDEVHMRYEDDTAAALKAGPQPDWVIWPESAMDGGLLSMDDGSWGMGLENQNTIARVQEGGEFPLIFGITEIEGTHQGDEPVMKDGAKFFNSLAVAAPDGSIQSFRKHHLVIFGEWIPLADKFPFLRKIYEQQAGASFDGSYYPGESFEPLHVAAGGRMISVIPSVCFEDTVGRLERRFARPGPQVIVNITNDGWFKESVAAEQQFANAVFRAIEIRCPLVRCANTGLSAAVTATGSPAHPDTGAPQIITDETGSHFTRAAKVVDLDVPLRAPFSWYVMAGDWTVIAMGFFGYISGHLLRRRWARKRRDEAAGNARLAAVDGAAEA